MAAATLLGLERYRVTQGHEAEMSELIWTALKVAEPRARARQAHSFSSLPLLLLFVGACAGIMLERMVFLALELWVMAALAFGTIWLLLWWVRQVRVASVMLLLSVAAVFGLWHQLCWRWFAAEELGFFASPLNQPVFVQGILLENPRLAPPPPERPMILRPGVPRTVVGFQAEAIRDGENWRRVTGYARLIVDGQLLGFRGGDRVRIVGSLGSLQPPKNPGEFDFAAYARGDRRLCSIHCPWPECVVKLSGPSPWNIGAWLRRGRGYCHQVLEKHLDDPQRGVATALLLGIRETIEGDLEDAFIQTGTLHLLAISGLHVGLMAAIVFRLWGWLWRREKLAALFTGLTVLGYALLVDVRPSVIRAAALVILYCLAIFLGRKARGFNLLGGAGLCVLIANPADLFRTGAQLSFLAAATILGGIHWWLQLRGMPPDEEPLEWPASWRQTWDWLRRGLIKLGELGLLSLWVFALLTPYTWKNFNLVSPIAPGLTVLLWPFLFVILICGFLLLLTDWLLPPLAWISAQVLSGCLWIFCQMVQYGREIPGSFFWIPGPPGWWVSGFYIILAAFALSRWLRRRWWIAGGIVLAWMLVLFSTEVLKSRPERLRCTFFAVGHGCAILLELPSGRSLLYDAGSAGDPQFMTPRLAQGIWAQGVRRLDAVIISHADADHYNLLPGLLERFSVGKLYVNRALFTQLTPAEHRDSDSAKRGESRQDQVDRAPEPLVGGLAASGIEASDYPEEEVAASPPEPGVAALAEILRRFRVHIEPLHAGDEVLLGDPTCRIRVLSPPKDYDTRAGSLAKRRERIHGDNAASLVVAVEYRGRRVLLTGDLDSPMLEQLMASPPLPCDVLQAPHHGSLGSNPEGLIEWCSPRRVVVSGGPRWFAPGVLAAYRRSGAEVYHTFLHGAVIWEHPGPEFPERQEPSVKFFMGKNGFSWVRKADVE